MANLVGEWHAILPVSSETGCVKVHVSTKRESQSLVELRIGATVGEFTAPLNLPQQCRFYSSLSYVFRNNFCQIKVSVQCVRRPLSRCNSPVD